MNITIINDCKDENVKGRQLGRVMALFNSPANFVGVSNEIEAAGNIIDILDSYGQKPGVILVNVAPRNGKAKKHANGTPFGYFWIKKTLVMASVDGVTLSLIKKLKLIKTVNVLDIPQALEIMVKKRFVPAELKNHIINTQFRSYDFLPRVAHYLVKNKNIISKKVSIDEFEKAPAAVWWVDNFGNCKTTLFAADIVTTSKKLVAAKFGKLPYYERLKDVPDKQAAIITGSSGFGKNRFLEIVVQGGNAAKQQGLSSGDVIT